MVHHIVSSALSGGQDGDVCSVGYSACERDSNGRRGGSCDINVNRLVARSVKDLNDYSSGSERVRDGEYVTTFNYSGLLVSESVPLRCTYEVSYAVYASLLNLTSLTCSVVVYVEEVGVGRGDGINRTYVELLVNGREAVSVLIPDERYVRIITTLNLESSVLGCSASRIRV